MPTPHISLPCFLQCRELPPATQKCRVINIPGATLNQWGREQRTHARLPRPSGVASTVTAHECTLLSFLFPHLITLLRSLTPASWHLLPNTLYPIPSPCFRLCFWEIQIRTEPLKIISQMSNIISFFTCKDYQGHLTEGGLCVGARLGVKDDFGGSSNGECLDSFMAWQLGWIHRKDGRHT